MRKIAFYFGIVLILVSSIIGGTMHGKKDNDYSTPLIVLAVGLVCLLFSLKGRSSEEEILDEEIVKCKKRILISVTDKTGIEKFGQLLSIGYEIISTGGTLKYLTEHGIPCIPIEDITGFPEMMDGRLKTLNPYIFGGILADTFNKEHLEVIAENGIDLIDIVVVNFYDFNADKRMEKIDIGGPSLLRAASKNGTSAIPLIDPADYDEVIKAIIKENDWRDEEIGTLIPDGIRKRLVLKVFRATCQYDREIYQWMESCNSDEKNFFKQ
ncbi:MAG: hypothetical protein NTW62_01005 [Candidatus Nomurabacteria bacterium]|nr:hypothetical protein [Candidatus Nomurabacteria bacterium]